MSIHKMFFLSMLALAASGCSADTFLVHNGNMPSADKVSMVKQGQTKNEVESILGSPSAVTSFDEKTWIYMSSTLEKIAFFTPQEKDREILTITFNAEGKVAEIKNYDLSSGKNISIDTAKTPVSGTKVGFFRRYFGGVGAYLPIAPSGYDDRL